MKPIILFFSTLHLKRFLFSHLFENKPDEVHSFLPNPPLLFKNVYCEISRTTATTGWPPYCNWKRRDFPITEENPHLLFFCPKILFFFFTNKKSFQKSSSSSFPFFLFLFLGTEQPWIENNKIALEKTHSCAFK